MRAMILTQQKRVDESPLAQQEMDAPRTGPGEVRVKVSVCAVCRTDIHIVEGDLALHKMPVIPGHQIVGRVDETALRLNRVLLPLMACRRIHSQSQSGSTRLARSKARTRQEHRAGHRLIH